MLFSGQPEPPAGTEWNPGSGSAQLFYQKIALNASGSEMRAVQEPVPDQRSCTVQSLNCKADAISFLKAILYIDITKSGMYNE